MNLGGSGQGKWNVPPQGTGYNTGYTQTTTGSTGYSNTPGYSGGGFPTTTMTSSTGQRYPATGYTTTTGGYSSSGMPSSGMQQMPGMTTTTYSSGYGPSGASGGYSQEMNVAMHQYQQMDKQRQQMLCQRRMELKSWLESQGADTREKKLALMQHYINQKRAEQANREMQEVLDTLMALEMNSGGRDYQLM